jgi:hypothetical protein
MDRKSLEVLMKIVQDPRYDQQKHINGLKPTAELKLAVMAGGLVGKLNRTYGWTLPENGDWSVEQLNDVLYEIVTKPGYTLREFISAIQSGRRL